MSSESFEIKDFLTALEALIKNGAILDEFLFRKLIRNLRVELNETLERLLMVYDSDELDDLIAPEVELIIECMINHSCGITRLLKYLKLKQDWKISE